MRHAHESKLNFPSSIIISLSIFQTSTKIEEKKNGDSNVLRRKILHERPANAENVDRFLIHIDSNPIECRVFSTIQRVVDFLTIFYLSNHPHSFAINFPFRFKFYFKCEKIPRQPNNAYSNLIDVEKCTADGVGELRKQEARVCHVD